MSSRQTATDRPPGAGPYRLLFWGAMLAALLASILLRGEATPDVSWLISMCERILDGERAYIDIFETTPPVPVLLYMPPVLFARLVAVTPETATIAFTYACALAALALSARILPDRVTDDGQTKWSVLLPASVILFVLPVDVFAEREYFAAAFALPLVSVFIHHAQAKVWPPLWERALAALLAGLTIAIKPPLFALPGLVLAAYYWSHTRSLSFLLSSGLLAAGAIGAAITAASIAAFPDYLGDITTVMRDVYVPVRSSFFSFLNDKGVIGVLWCLALTLILSVRQKLPVTVIVSAMVAIGFLGAYLVQAKYFFYHVYPAALFAGIAAWIMTCGRLRTFAGKQVTVFALAAGIYALAILVTAILFLIGFDDRRPVMSNLKWATGLDHPRALALSPDLATSYPLARRINATWVDRAHSQWVARYTRFAMLLGGLSDAERDKFAQYHRQDLEWILRQIATKKPDLIIQEARPGYSWLTSELLAMEPGFLDGYEVIAEEGGIKVLRRKPESGPKPS